MLRFSYHDAQDGIADALLDLYEEALVGTWRDPPRSWPGKLYWKARTCISQQRQRARVLKTRSLRRSNLEITAAGDPIRLLIGRLSPLPALNLLTPRERRVILARADGLTYSDMADTGLATAAHARKLYERARRKLKKWCREEDAA